jgi:hypothetical protein
LPFSLNRNGSILKPPRGLRSAAARQNPRGLQSTGAGRMRSLMRFKFLSYTVTRLSEEGYKSACCFKCSCFLWYLRVGLLWPTGPSPFKIAHLVGNNGAEQRLQGGSPATLFFYSPSMPISANPFYTPQIAPSPRDLFCIKLAFCYYLEIV